MTKKLFLTTIYLLSVIGVFAQSNHHIEYTYDAAGNRIKREFVLNYSAPAHITHTQPPDTSGNNQVAADAPVKPQVYNDVIAEQKISIYPNPTKGQIKIEASNFSTINKASIKMYDLAGRLVSEIKSFTEPATIDISGSPSGTYIMKIMINDKEAEWKIIKQ